MIGSIIKWQARIKIGRWNSREDWVKSVHSRAACWLERPPHIQLPGKTARERVLTWQVGALLLACDNNSVRKYASKYSELLSIPTVESTFLAYALKAKGVLSQDDEEQIKARFEHYADSGMVPYHGKSFFVDTIGMICPFLYTCGMDDLADRQISGYDSALYAGVFPFHSYDFERKLPLGVCDWARGTGWYILGLLGSDHNRVRILKLADNMLRLQRRDGGFGCFLFNPESHIESSGSAVAGLLFERAYRLSGETQYLLAAKKVEKALMGMTRRDGSLDYAQGDTSGAGMYSDRFDILPFAQGMTLLLVERLDTYNKHE